MVDTKVPGVLVHPLKPLHARTSFLHVDYESNDLNLTGEVRTTYLRVHAPKNPFVLQYHSQSGYYTLEFTNLLKEQESTLWPIFEPDVVLGFRDGDSEQVYGMEIYRRCDSAYFLVIRCVAEGYQVYERIGRELVDLDADAGDPHQRLVALFDDDFNQQELMLV